MRALWSGSLSFGLINVPVRIFSGATVQSGIELSMLHGPDLSPIRYARICRQEEREVPYEEIVKGFEYRDGEYVVLSEEELENADAAKSSIIEIKYFSKESEIDIRFYEKPYYLEPAKGAEKPYVLLRQALSKSRSIAVCTFVLRSREHLGVVKPVGEALVLDQMRFAQEISEPAGLRLPTDTEVTTKELEIAMKLVDQLTEEFDAGQFHDTYVEDLREIIQRKIDGKKPPRKGRRSAGTPSKDLMQVLKASLEAAAKSRAS